MKKEYIGDGVYIEDQGFQVRLFTERENGVHEIFLGPAEWQALDRTIERWWNIHEHKTEAK